MKLSNQESNNTFQKVFDVLNHSTKCHRARRFEKHNFDKTRFKFPLFNGSIFNRAF